MRRRCLDKCLRCSDGHRNLTTNCSQAGDIAAADPLLQAGETRQLICCLRKHRAISATRDGIAQRCKMTLYVGLGVGYLSGKLRAEASLRVLR